MVAVLEDFLKRGEEKMVKNVKLKTFFFKEYAQIAEKNTYSAYVPSGNGGIWCIADYDEKLEHESSEIVKKLGKNKKIEKVNLAKIGVQKVVEKYFENSDFLVENVEKMMEFSKDKVVFEKLKFQNFYKNEKNLELKNLYSQIIVMAYKNNLIVGNIGKTALVIYRENKILEKISEEIVKKFKLEKNDYLVAGSPEFWKIVNETEIAEIYIDGKSKENIEKNLSEQIKLAEKKLGKVIPFLSILVEDIEFEKNYELLENEIIEKNQKREMAVKYVFLVAMFVFMFVSVGKNIQNGNLTSERKEKVRNVLAEKIVENIDFLKKDLAIKVEREKNKIKQENAKNIEEKEKEIGENKNVIQNEEVKSKGIENKNLANLETNLDIEGNKVKNAEKLDNQKVQKKIFKNKKYNRKNLNIENRNFKRNYRIKNNKILQLEKEIERNWEVLGRDRNGNDFGEI